MGNVNNIKIPANTTFRVLLIFVMALLSCQKSDAGEDPTPPAATAEWIKLDNAATEFTYEGGTVSRSYSLAQGVDLSAVETSLSYGGDEWCTATLASGNLTIRAERSWKEFDRLTTLTLAYGKQKKVTLNIKQTAAPSSDDTKIKVTGGHATSEEANSSNWYPFSNSYDGDKSTYFNSAFGAVSYPFYLDYELESGHTLSSIVYTPRTDSGNKWGSFDIFKVEASTAAKPSEWIEIGSYARGQGIHTVFTIKLGSPIADVKHVRFTIEKGYEDRVSCAEMEFFEASGNKFDPSEIFADDLCTVLRSDVTEKQIRQIPNEHLKALALALLSDSYDTSYRLADYRPYQHPSVMATRNKTNRYSLRDNVTGLYARQGEKLAVIVGKLYAGAEIQMMIQDLTGGYNNHKYYTLYEGYNEITAEIGGLIYVLNHTLDEIPLLLENADAATLSLVNQKTVSIHFANASVNGYFDIARNTADEWPAIRDNAKYPDIDVVGKYSHLTWRVSDFKKYDTPIVRTIENCDRLTWLEQEFMGVVKYGRMFNNRMHFCIDYKAASPNASDYRTVYNASDYYAEPFCNPDRFPARCWGPAHEVGHCNQTRPGLKWAGTTEVTNNIMSLYIQTSLGQPCKLLVDSCTPKDEQGNVIAGSYSNIYEAARLLIVDGGRAHCLPDIGNNIVPETKLVPFWQLKLYMIDVLKKEDFYHDLYEHFRNNPSPSESGGTSGEDQLDFVRQVCAISGLNMLDFFEKWGFLKPVNTVLNDYGNKTFVITQKQADDLRAEINAKGYAQPAANLHLITESNLDNYR